MLVTTRIKRGWIKSPKYKNLDIRNFLNVWQTGNEPNIVRNILASY